jgi:hypothetical protein
MCSANKQELCSVQVLQMKILRKYLDMWAAIF